jgi:protocatechuate 3,4-dioxygenase beta subunit
MDEPSDELDNFGALTRRHALTGLAAAGAATLPFGAQAVPAARTSLLPGANVCVLTPAQAEGPYYFDPKLVRADMTEGKTGVPLGLVLQVVEAGDCKPVSGARVDIWQADALGIYSGYDRQSDARNVSTKGDTFLRGSQLTGENGQVTFTTIYPGWYRGRTPHIHCKVFLSHKTVLTTQLYFPDALSEFIYINVKPYNTRGHKRDTLNTTDAWLRQSGGSHDSFCAVKEEADRYLASLIIGVDRSGIGLAQSGPPPRPGPARAGSLVPGVVTRE